MSVRAQREVNHSPNQTLGPGRNQTVGLRHLDPMLRGRERENEQEYEGEMRDRKIREKRN